MFGIVASSRPLRPRYAWDAAQSATVQQADGSATPTDGVVATWCPARGPDAAATRWTSQGTTAAVLQQLGGSGGPSRAGIRSAATNLLLIPAGTLLSAYGWTWMVAYRWMGNPGSPAHVIGKGAATTGSVVMRKRNGRDEVMWSGYIHASSDALSTFDAARDLGSLRVAVLQIWHDTNYTYGKNRLTNPTTPWTWLSGAITGEPTAAPWALGGFPSAAVNPAVQGGADIALHEVQAYPTLLKDGQITSITARLTTKWA